MPARYQFAASTQPTEASTRPAATSSLPPAPPTNLAIWWRSFNDPVLNDLIIRGVRANLDLKIATARLIQARAQYGITSAYLYPQVNLDGSAVRQRVSLNGPDFVDLPPSYLSSVNPTYDLFQVGFDATWELDVFGGQRRAVEAAKADIQAAWQNRRDVLVSLLAETARNYIEYRALQRRLALTHQDIASEEQTVSVTRARFKAGLTSDLDVARAEAEVKTTTAQLPALSQQLQASLETLAVTLGTHAQDLQPELQTTKPIPVAPPAVPIGLPSDLLRRRPDVRAAERQIASATAQIGVATAELFPQFTLTGSLGLQSDHFKSIGNFNSRYWSIGPSMSWPILDFGRLRANVHVQEAITQQQAANYQKVVLQAIADVETSLNAYGNERQRRIELAEAVNAQQRALNLANQLYKQGVGEFLDVLDAQRSLFTAEDLLAQSDQAVSADLVSLYKALGGGWE